MEVCSGEQRYTEVHGEMSRGLWRCMEGSAEVHGGVCRGVWRCVVGNDDQSNSNPVTQYTCLSYWL